MKRLKSIAIKLLRPSIAWIICLTPVSAAALIFTFATGRDTSALGYISYVLSAYTMTVTIINFSDMMRKTREFILENRFGKRTKAFLYSHEHSRRYMTDISFRVKISLYISLFMNLLYAAFKLTAGVYYASFWYGADAIYYIVLSAARALLTIHMRNGEQDLAKEYRRYRSCGYLLFALNAALTGVVYQIANQNMGYKYPGLLIYIVALFAFINIISTVVNMVRFRKINRPVLSAVKIINFAKALVAMFALQSAMLSYFGTNISESSKQLVNGICGGGVCFTVFIIAVFMVIRANKKLKALDTNKSEI